MTPKRHKLVLGFSQAVMNLPFRLANVESMKVAARGADVGLLVTDGKGSMDVEVRNIDWLLARGVDALIVSSLSGEGMYAAYERVVKRHVPLVIFVSGVPIDTKPQSCYVGPDEISMGSRAATYVGGRLEGEGRIVVLRGVVGSTNSRLRGIGFESEMTRAFPGIEIVGRETAGWLRQPSREFIEGMLATGERFDAVFAENDEMALGAVDALRRWRRQSDAFVVGVDGQYEALVRIRQGGPFAMTIKSESNGKVAVEVAIAAALGREVPERVVLDAPLIDRKNVEDFLNGNMGKW